MVISKALSIQILYNGIPIYMYTVYTSTCIYRSPHCYKFCRYSNGDVRVWDIAHGENYTLKPTSTALQIDNSRDSGTIANLLRHVTISEKYVASAYTQGQ